MKNEKNKTFFNINAKQYIKEKDFFVYRPASLNNPLNNSVMFITKTYENQADALLKCENCLVFCDKTLDINVEMEGRHAIVYCENARLDYCSFFKENGITNLPQREKYECMNGAYIGEGASIGRNTIIMPMSFIGSQVEIGDNCYIGYGVKIVGEVYIGSNVVIRENSVIGADGLSTDRNTDGIALTMPQFGGVVLEDGVQIGALTVIARGAIDHTVVKRGSKIDNSSFISHNVCIGEDTFVVGETIMFGSSKTENKVLISGNSAIRNGVQIGEKAVIGMGAVVVKNVKPGDVVKGNPAR